MPSLIEQEKGSQVAAGILPAVEGGIVPPGLALDHRGHTKSLSDYSAGQDARLYGRQDARRYASAAEASETLIDQFLVEQSRLTAVEKFSRNHEQHRLPDQQKFYRDLIPLNKPRSGEQYAFVVDLDQCSGCKACVCACHSLNGLDEGETWRSVGLLVSAPIDDRLEVHGSRYPLHEPHQQHVTTACHHCLEPACADGCPVLAYEKDPVTGIVRHLDDQCIGCQYCVLKCPYDVPKYSEARGIVRKCDMCHSRLAVGEAPACVQACPHEAIRIEIVDQTATRKAGAMTQARLVPGAVESNLTLPTTRYKTRKPLPTVVRPADDTALRLEEAHWPLVFMLVLTQLAAGLHLVMTVLSLAGRADRLPVLSWAAAGALLLGLNISVTHLGRPLKAWRAVLGWRKSWMSREIIVFSAYAGLAAWLALWPWNRAVTMIIAIVSLAGVACSGMIYVDTRRPMWAARIVFTKFSGTTLLLGATGGAVWAGWCSPDLAPALVAAATVIRTALFAWESMNLLRGKANLDSSLHSSALIAFNHLQPVLSARVLLFAASTVLSVMAVFDAWNQGALFGAIAGVTTLTSQLIERYMFFVTCKAPRMPGGVA